MSQGVSWLVFWVHRCIFGTCTLYSFLYVWDTSPWLLNFKEPPTSSCLVGLLSRFCCIVCLYRVRRIGNMLQYGIGWNSCLAQISSYIQVDAFWYLGPWGVCRDFGESLWSVERLCDSTTTFFTCDMTLICNMLHNTPRESDWRHFDFSTIVLSCSESRIIPIYSQHLISVSKHSRAAYLA